MAIKNARNPEVTIVRIIVIKFAIVNSGRISETATAAPVLVRPKT